MLVQRCMSFVRWRKSGICVFSPLDRDHTPIPDFTFVLMLFGTVEIQGVNM